MKFIIKLFAEITIKSDSVRRKMVRQLYHNLHTILHEDAPGSSITRYWDRLEVVPAPGREATIRAILTQTPGIAHILEAEEIAYDGMADLVEKVASHYAGAITSKRFRCRTQRSGKTDFTSIDFDRALGTRLLELNPTAKVDLHHPDVVVHIAIHGPQAWRIIARHEGLGGYPLGELGAGLSLISGGFDSGVATYLALRRGLLTHFCLFRLGGEPHIRSVLPQVYTLWRRHARSHNPRLVIVPFEGVVEALKAHTDPGLLGVLLKRMMFKAAERVAHKARAGALITGESLAQVASQTLTNLNRIDSAIDMMVIRPLITMHKQEIIAQAERIGLAHHAACTPEYCGALIERPHASASAGAIDKAEAAFPWEVLDQALEAAEVLLVRNIPERATRSTSLPIAHDPGDGLVVDLRDAAEAADHPCPETALALPYTQLDERLHELPKDRRLMLYCTRGLLSAVAGERLREMGFDVAIYRPGE
ncbi:MAG: tRNA uracil 4-sulfurtransferase ThiI [Gammaproteobacteria bacterium]|nr:tRNA uracil 4-sulfurtransferase ThiI [Gammaproteobacteria bacterium]